MNAALSLGEKAFMNLVLMRHASRIKNVPEVEAGLTDDGQKMTTETANAMKSKRIFFDIVLHSKAAAAKQTALQLAPEDKVEEFLPLTPHSQEDLNWESIKKRIREDQLSNEGYCIALVGHHPRITRLLKLLTGKNCRTIERGEAVQLNGSPSVMERGNATVSRTFGSTHSSELLRKKIELKMTVSTFLAGFTIPVLVELVKDPTEGFSAFRAAATVLFTLALGLFVVAVYMYDELLMPVEYWGPPDESHQPKRNSTFAHDYRLNGPLYAYMVRTWKWIFTPAVVSTSIGFLLLLIDHFLKEKWFSELLVESGFEWLEEQWFWPLTVFILCFLALAVIFGVYLAMRPRLGIED